MHRCERHPALLVSHSTYNNPHLRIQPTPKSTARKLVLTVPQNWSHPKPLLTPNEEGTETKRVSQSKPWLPRRITPPNEEGTETLTNAF
jgi:hypothetical protein